jgi:hypothetical protein
MHSQHFTHDPRLAGWAYGFHEQVFNGRRLIGHPGALDYFHSRLALLPAEALGLFVAYNSAEGEEAHLELLQAFLDQFYPAPALPTPEPIVGHGQRTFRYAGYYRSTRSAYTTLEKLGNLIYPEVVKAGEEGQLLYDGEAWLEVEPLLFRQVEGEDILLFREDERGRITNLFRQNRLDAAWQRMAWYETNPVQYTALAIAVLFFLSMLLLAPRLYSRASLAHPRLAWAARWLAFAPAGLNLLFVVVLVIILDDPDQVAYGISSLLTAVLVIPLVTTPLALALVPLSLLAWRCRFWRQTILFHYTLFTLASLLFAGWLAYWNLLGFRY